MDPDLARLLRGLSRALPVLIPIAILVLPSILRTLAQRQRQGTPGAGGAPSTPSTPPAGPAAPIGGPEAEDDLVAQVRRMLEQRQGIPPQPPPAAPPVPRPSVSRVPKALRPARNAEDEVEARGIAHRGDPATAPPRYRSPRRDFESGQARAERRRAGRPARTATEFAVPAAGPVSAAEQKDAKQMAAGRVAGSSTASAALVAAAVVAGTAVPTGRELVDAIARNPLSALLAAEVFGPCRAAGEIGEGPTSPVGLRGS